MSFPNSTWIDQSQIYQFTRTTADFSYVNIFINSGENLITLGLFDDQFDPPQTKNFTFMTWFNLDDISSYQGGHDFGIFGGNRLQIIIRTFQNPSNNIWYPHYYFGFFGEFQGKDVSGSVVTTQTWQHLACTYDGTTQRIYVNGILDVSNNPNGSNNTNLDTVFFGSWFNNTETIRLFKGRLANTFIFDTDLSESDINYYKDTYTITNTIDNSLNFAIVDNSYAVITGGTPNSTLSIPTNITYLGTTYPVEEISGNAFQNNNNIIALDASNSNLITIRNSAFFNAYNIATIDFSGSNNLIEIETLAFQAVFNVNSINFTGCSSLTIIGPDSLGNGNSNPDTHNKVLTSLDFTDCYKLSNIGNNAFENDVSLSSITFGSKTQPTFGTNVFSNINPSANIYVNWWANFSNEIQGVPVVKLYNDLDYEIKSSDSISNVNYASLKIQYLSSKFTILRSHLDNSFQLNRNLSLPEYIQGYPLKELQNLSFYDQASIDMNLDNITIPDTVIEIGSSSFGIGGADQNGNAVVSESEIQDMYNRSLKNIFLPIGKLDAIVSGTQRNRLLSINSGLFQHQSKIESIFIPDTVDTIGGFILKNTWNLERIFFAGDKPTSVASNIFVDMSSNPIIYISPWATGWASTFGGNETLDVSLNLNNQGLTYYSEQINLLQDSSFNTLLTSNDLSGDLTCFIYSVPNHGFLFDQNTNTISTTNGHYVLPTNYIKYVSNSYYHGVDTIKYYLIDNSRNFVEYHQLDINIAQQFLNSTWVNISNLYQFTRTDADLTNVNIFIDSGETPQSLGLVGPNPGLNSGDGFSSFTVMTWLYFDDDNGNPYGDYGIVGSNALHLILRKNNNLPTARYYFSFFGQDIQDGPDVTPYEWHHVTYYFDAPNRTMKMYIDGIQHPTEHYPNHLNNTSDQIYFGSWFNSFDLYRRFKGYLANTLIFNTNLSDLAINHFKNTYPVYGGTINGLEYTILNPLYATIINGASASGNVVIPASITHNGIEYPVIQIFNNAFLSNTSIVTIQLPISITSIGDYAFSGCINLTTINLDECTSLTSIGQNAFENCTPLQSIDLTNLTNLTTFSNSAFKNSGIESIILPISLNQQGETTFENCLNLNSITYLGPCPSDLNTNGSSLSTSPFKDLPVDAKIYVYYQYSSTNPDNSGPGPYYLTEYQRASTIPVIIIDPPPPPPPPPSKHCCPKPAIIDKRQYIYQNGQNASKLFTCINGARRSRNKYTIPISQSNITNICDINLNLMINTNVSVSYSGYQQHIDNINRLNNSKNCQILGLKFPSRLARSSLF